MVLKEARMEFEDCSSVKKFGWVEVGPLFISKKFQKWFRLSIEQSYCLSLSCLKPSYIYVDRIAYIDVLIGTGCLNS